MSKKARTRVPEVSPAVAEKMKELAELIAAEKFGPGGVPREITFSEIEEIGHQAGQMLAAQVDQNLVANHGDHFDDEQACPQCGTLCPCEPHRRELVTRDGPAELTEPACYCSACRRSFFPSARSAKT